MATDNKEPLKILITNFEFPPIGGGAGKANKCILEEFANIPNLQIDFLTSQIDKTENIKFAENINVYKIGISKKDLHHWRKREVIEWLWKANKQYRNLISKNNYDLAHAFFAFPTGWLCYKYRHQLPYIISLRGSDVPGYNSKLKIDYIILSKLFRNIWVDAEKVIANSNGLKELAEKFTPELDIDVIPNGINTTRFKPNIDLQNESFNLLTVSRLVERKRIDQILKAVKILKGKKFDIVFNIAGEGKQLQFLKKLTLDLNISDCVNFLGIIPQSEIPQVYQKNNAFIMCSEHEGMSNAMLEAMASGMPIITTPCEGTSELIKDNGIVLESSEPEQIVKAVEKLYHNKDIREKMSTESRNASDKFSWKNTADSYLNIYRKVVEEK